jgi:imidazole glycerol-phosphate synthase subunit HisH
LSKDVVVVDYGIGNLWSVCKCFEHCGGTVELTGSPSRIANASRLILPGVGAFGNCMAELRDHDLIGPIQQFLNTERPFLGICVGMQMMLEYSEEFGHHDGLGLFPGRVTAIPKPQPDAEQYKIPHNGWGQLKAPGDVNWQGSILEACENDSYVYFNHGYSAAPENEAHCLAECSYHGHRITAVIGDGIRYGCQFHPEKSADIGLAIAAQFLSL